jgi:tetratricopeptide (TPR) repeat protein
MTKIACLLLFSVLVPAQPSADSLLEARRALEDQNLAGAESLAAKILGQSPDSPAVHTFLGELHLREGQIAAAEKELKKALELDENFARAWYELSRVFGLASLHHRAELALIQAHAFAPEEGAYERSLANVRWPREHLDKARLASDYIHYEVPFGLLVSDARHLRALSVPVSINGGKPLQLMLDTGASGILLRTKAADKAGLGRISETKVGGIGDQGTHDAWTSEADKLQIGAATFTKYRLEITDKGALADEDGIIGTDVFSDFLVTLDFSNKKLLLDPLPGGMPDRSRTFDRTVTAEFKGFSPVYRLGHKLLIETKINQTGPFLFIIDTGSNTSLIAKKVAKAATRVHSEDDVTIKGLSGKVNKVYSADQVTIQFANFRQRNQGMIAFDLDSLSSSHGIEIGGILGLPLLTIFQSLTIDYRDGLVKFDYKD